MDKDHLIGIRIAKKLALGRFRTAARKGNILVGKNDDTTRNRVAGARKRLRFEVMVAERRLIGELQS
jgi:hypothetical protein